MKYRFLSAAVLLSMAGPAMAASEAAPGIVLAPGEAIIGSFVLGAPIVRVPHTSAVMTAVPLMAETPAAPPYEIDPVTKRPRNQTGWSGSQAAPAAIACFPRGACAHLNGG